MTGSTSDGWRCTDCGKGEAEGATRKQRNGWGRLYLSPKCVECYSKAESARLRRMRAERSARRERERAIREREGQIGRSGFSIARPLPLAWEINARNDEAEAVRFDRLDPERAAKLRDRAQNWRALAAEIGSLGVRGRAL